MYNFPLLTDTLAREHRERLLTESAASRLARAARPAARVTWSRCLGPSPDGSDCLLAEFPPE
jgi:hypothetical protein